LQQITNPLVMAGDMNTTNRANTPTSVRNEIIGRVTDYQFWISRAVSYFHPLGIYQHALQPVRYTHGLNELVEGRISDHPPMTVDLPLHEPTAPSSR
jgi:hypothetical protein